MVAGDIFHDGRKDGKLSPNAILLFKQFVKHLQGLGTVVIIAGNHDNNITYQSSHAAVKRDTLSCVLADVTGLNTSIFYLHQSGTYLLGNPILYHTSVFDIDKLSEPEHYEQRRQF